MKILGLQLEYAELENMLEFATDKEKLSIRGKMGHIDREIGRLRMNKFLVNKDPMPIGSTSCSLHSAHYAGPTTHGVSIGEGCYWNRGGHH